MAPVRTGSRAGPLRRGIRLRASFAWVRICLELACSAEAPSSRAALPAPLPSSLAARPTRSATSSRTCLRSTCLSSGTTRHPLGNRDRVSTSHAQHLPLAVTFAVLIAQPEIISKFDIDSTNIDGELNTAEAEPRASDGLG